MRVNLIIEAREAKLVPPLSIILGQYQLPGQKFCSDINKLTENFESGVPISLSVKKKNAVEYTVRINGPKLSFLISQSADEFKNIPVEILFDIFKFKSRYNLESGLGNFDAKNIFSTLRSCQLSLIIL